MRKKPFRDINDKLELPPFLEIEKEVTGDKIYSNFEIAKKKGKK